MSLEKEISVQLDYRTYAFEGMHHHILLESLKPCKSKETLEEYMQSVRIQIASEKAFSVPAQEKNGKFKEGLSIIIEIKQLKEN